MSTKNKLMLLVVSSLLLLAAGAAAFTLRTSEQAMLEQQAANGKNSVALALRNVAREYDTLFTAKASQAKALRQTMLNLSTTTQGFALMWDDAETFLQKMPLPDGIIMYVLDSKGQQLFDRGDTPQISPYGLHDIKDQPVLDTAMRLARANFPAVCLVKVQTDTGSRRFYGRHIYLQEKELLVGLWQDISLLDQTQDAWQANSIDLLNKYFATISLGPSGRLFAVNEQGHTVIGPNDMRSDMNVPGPGGKTLFEEMQTAAQTPDVPLRTRSSFLFPENESREIMIHLEKSKKFNWIVGGISYMDEARAPGRRLSVSLVLGILASMLFILPVTVWFLTKVTSPLTTLADYARRIPEQNFLEEAPPQPVMERLAAHGATEIAELSRSFLFMDATLRSRVRELMENTSLKERLQGELAAATEIQNGFLPSTRLADESRGRFSLLASLVPARAVGGDLYDYFMLDDDRLCFVIGDVSDKGIPAALFMSMTLSLIRSNVHKTSSPDALMQEVNNALAKDNAKCMFVTLFIGVLHLSTGELRYANGGHNQPLLLRSNLPPLWLESRREPVVGVMEDSRYTQLELQMLPGDILFLYTDGLNEAMDAQSALYGNDRMITALQNADWGCNASLLEYVLHDVAEHVGDTPPSDDMTILCVHYHHRTSETPC